MRIIAGKLGGRNFISPNGHRTHPMSDKIRGALFNVLGDIDDLSILDAFAGSGALSFEAISRGASRAVAIDNDRNAQQAITANITGLNLSDKIKLVKAGAGAWLETTNDNFDIVLIDPPFDSVQEQLLTRLADRVKIDGLVVLSLPPDEQFSLTQGFEKLQSKNYGDATLAFYRRLS